MCYIHSSSHLPPWAAQDRRPDNSHHMNCRNTRQTISSPVEVREGERQRGKERDTVRLCHHHYTTMMCTWHKVLSQDHSQLFNVAREKRKDLASYQKSHDLHHDSITLCSQNVTFETREYPSTPGIYFIPLWSIQWLHFNILYAIKPCLTPIVSGWTLKVADFCPPTLNFHPSYRWHR